MMFGRTGINETRMHAVWKLGALLAKVERRAGRFNSSRDGTNSFGDFLAGLELDKNAAVTRQRIGAMPADELEKALAAAHKGCDGPNATQLTMRVDEKEKGRRTVFETGGGKKREDQKTPPTEGNRRCRSTPRRLTDNQPHAKEADQCDTNRTSRRRD
jgi:hypothetical protein